MLIRRGSYENLYCKQYPDGMSYDDRVQGPATYSAGYKLHILADNLS